MLRQAECPPRHTCKPLIYRGGAAGFACVLQASQHFSATSVRLLLRNAGKWWGELAPLRNSGDLGALPGLPLYAAEDPHLRRVVGDQLDAA